jgi:hypothetical protein
VKSATVVTCDHQARPSVAISGHQWPSVAISGHQWPSVAISGTHLWSAVESDVIASVAWSLTKSAVQLRLRVHCMHAMRGGASVPNQEHSQSRELRILHHCVCTWSLNAYIPSSGAGELRRSLTISLSSREISWS